MIFLKMYVFNTEECQELLLLFFIFFMTFYQNPELQIKFLKSVLNINSESKILDVGCYEGWHLNELQKISPKIYGIDINKPKTELKNFILGDVFTTKLEQELPEKLDGVYLLAPFFGENWNEYENLFNKLNSTLKVGGKIVLDLYFFNDLNVGHKYQQYKMLPEKVILEDNERQEDCMFCKRTFLFKDWTREAIELRWKSFTQKQLEDLAVKTGFNLGNIYYEFDVNKIGNLEPSDKKRRRVAMFEKQGRHF